MRSSGHQGTYSRDVLSRDGIFTFTGGADGWQVCTADRGNTSLTAKTSLTTNIAWNIEGKMLSMYHLSSMHVSADLTRLPE